MTVGMNIGCYSESLGAGSILTRFPHVMENVDISLLIEDLRSEEGISKLFEWATECHVTPSSICLYLTVDSHCFRVRMINVREFRQVWEAKYKTTWKW
jgi:hypothetical protein